ncbi:MAG: LysR family transcriptional regulator, partial [Litorimonas sp.]
METLRTELFLDVMSTGSFAATAQARNLAPSTVSRAVAALEDDLGVRLFHRTTRTLSPTDEAALLARRVQPLVRS